VFGDECVVDLALGEAAELAIEQALRPTPEAPPALPQTPTGPSVESVVNRVRAIADGPSPYRHHAVGELRRFVADDRMVLQAALSEIGQLLAQHEQRSARTADSEWLQLITAKRLLQDTLEQEARTYS
jgi:hypothetical protein